MFLGVTTLSLKVTTSLMRAALAACVKLLSPTNWLQRTLLTVMTRFQSSVLATLCLPLRLMPCRIWLMVGLLNYSLIERTSTCADTINQLW